MSDFKDVSSHIKSQKHKDREAQKEAQQRAAQKAKEIAESEKESKRREKNLQAQEKKYWNFIGNLARIVHNVLDDFGNAIWHDGKRNFLMPREYVVLGSKQRSRRSWEKAASAAPEPFGSLLTGGIFDKQGRWFLHGDENIHSTCYVIVASSDLYYFVNPDANYLAILDPGIPPIVPSFLVGILKKRTGKKWKGKTVTGGGGRQRYYMWPVYQDTEFEVFGLKVGLTEKELREALSTIFEHEVGEQQLPDDKHEKYSSHYLGKIANKISVETESARDDT